MVDTPNDNKAEIPDTSIEVRVKAGKKYSFCTCGQSKVLPYCDNSHKEYNKQTSSHYRSFKVFPAEDSSLYVSSSNWKKEEE